MDLRNFVVSSSCLHQLLFSCVMLYRHTSQGGCSIPCSDWNAINSSIVANNRDVLRNILTKLYKIVSGNALTLAASPRITGISAQPIAEGWAIVSYMATINPVLLANESSLSMSDHINNVRP